MFKRGDKVIRIADDYKGMRKGDRDTVIGADGYGSVELKRFGRGHAEYNLKKVEKIKVKREEVSKMKGKIIKALKKKANEVTKEWSKRYEDGKKYTKEARQLAKLITEVDCAQAPVKKIVEILYGGKIPPSKGKLVGINESFLVLVPTGNSNSHNYEIGEPVIMIGTGEHGISVDQLKEGNDLTNEREEIRSATPKEIDKLLSNEAVLRSIESQMKFVVIE